MHLEEKTVSSQEIFSGKVFRVTKDMALLENDTQAVREVVHHNGGVTVIPVTDNNEIIMVRQYRYPNHHVLLEIPAGKLEKGESHYECGKRELLEETGCTCTEYTYMGEIYPTPAYVSEIIHMYMAKGLKYEKQSLDSDEFLDVEKVPLEDAFRMVMDGKICDSKTQIGILKAYFLLNK